jgi:hypothetical protein
MNFFRAACVAFGLLSPNQAAAQTAPVPPPLPHEARPPAALQREASAQKARERAQKETVTALKKQLEFLAILWTEVGRTLEEALKEEAEADRLEKEVVDLDDKSKRALLLIEQTEARRARALSRLGEVEISAENSAGSSAGSKVDRP